MVERPPEAQTPPAGAAPAGGAPLPTQVPGGQIRPASIVMGTFSLPTQTGGAPPALDNVRGLFTTACRAWVCSHVWLYLGAAHQQRPGIAGRAHANHLHPCDGHAFQRAATQCT